MADKSQPTPGPSSSGFQPADWFWESRKKGPSTSGAILFVLLRVLDLPLQWYLLRNGGVGVRHLVNRWGGFSLIRPDALSDSNNALGLNPYQTLILVFTLGSVLKQVYWRLFICETIMPPSLSIGVGLYNNFLNSVNSTLALWSMTSQQPLDQSSVLSFIKTAPPTLRVAIPLYAAGLWIEFLCEVQRKQFKSMPENKGKPYAGGLFGLARNINYGGYTAWRTAYALICGGWPWAAVVAAWLVLDFRNRAVPSMDAYCEKRYGAQWDEVRKQVPHKLFPWIY